jgi:hypothetical protein
MVRTRNALLSQSEQIRPTSQVRRTAGAVYRAFHRRKLRISTRSCPSPVLGVLARTGGCVWPAELAPGCLSMTGTLQGPLRWYKVPWANSGGWAALALEPAGNLWPLATPEPDQLTRRSW